MTSLNWSKSNGYTVKDKAKDVALTTLATVQDTVQSGLAKTQDTLQSGLDAAQDAWAEQVKHASKSLKKVQKKMKPVVASMQDSMQAGLEQTQDALQSGLDGAQDAWAKNVKQARGHWLQSLLPEVDWRVRFVCKGEAGVLIVSISSRDAALQGRERYLMPQPTSLLLPDVGRGDLMVAISASFPELEDPLDNSWDLRQVSAIGSRAGQVIPHSTGSPHKI